jgi:hypothetical protein
MNHSSSRPVKFPGITSRFTKGRSGAALAIAGEFHAGHRSGHVGGVGQHIGVDANGVGRIGAGQPHATSAFGRTMPVPSVHPASGRPNCAVVSGLASGNST